MPGKLWVQCASGHTAVAGVPDDVHTLNFKGAIRTDIQCPRCGARMSGLPGRYERHPDGFFRRTGDFDQAFSDRVEAEAGAARSAVKPS